MSRTQTEIGKGDQSRRIVCSRSNEEKHRARYDHVIHSTYCVCVQLNCFGLVCYDQVETQPMQLTNAMSVQRLATPNDHLPIPPLHRNGTLPPIGIERETSDTDKVSSLPVYTIFSESLYLPASLCKCNALHTYLE